MTLSVWRYAHLALAVISSLFLLILAVTGVVLAIDAVYEKWPAHRVQDFDSLTLSEVVPVLSGVYPEIIELSVDHNRFVTIDATDGEGNRINAYIDPRDGKVLGQVAPKSQFVQWNIALHRSLFLKETGRIIVGLASFLLLLITITGVLLIIKRQQGIAHFFSRINNDFFNQYFHVFSGRLLLVPVFLLALTGTYLFLIRVELVKKPGQEKEVFGIPGETPARKAAEFPSFQQIRLSEVEKVEFPFVPDDPEEHFVIKLKDRMLTVSQLNGEVLEAVSYPYAALLEKLSLDLHTGRTNAWWAIVLGIASLNILAFIYTGFAITFRRTQTRIKNKFRPQHAEIILLVGSENGSTLFFANQIHRQLLADGRRSYLAGMDSYGIFPEATHLILFTSTYGLGSAPANAANFEYLVRQHPQPRRLHFSVVGFGSKAYPDFCRFAGQVDELLAGQAWASRFTTLYTVNDRSPGEFVKWVHAWSEKSLIALATAPAVYQMKVTGLSRLRVVGKTLVSEDNSTFRLLLRPEPAVAFESGDLLAIYPAGDGRERFYSIGRSNGLIQLVVKLYPDGLGSGYLYRLEENHLLSARVMKNAGFHFPAQAGSVAMIANGTGIAPFLGMVMDNHRGVPVHLYAGFRHDNTLVKEYRRFAADQLAANRLKTFRVALSREENPQYVMDLIREDAQFFSGLLSGGGVIMICGSLKMLRDVELVLDEICRSGHNRELSYYTARGQVLTDCY